ncbi:hypothetical protein XENTR_v10015901 [Xenopus tropicalis]|nr:hypothetical protein XENTR_v10015901 [Xenopus tropicalis]
MVLEWGKISEDDGKYTPLIQLNSDGVKTFSEDSKKYELFVPLVRKGNCTLVIKPTGATDNGAYEVWMTLDGELYESLSRTRITVSGGSRALGSRAEAPTTKMTLTAIKNAAAMNSKEPIGVKNSSNFFALLLEKHGKSAIIVVIAVLSFLTLTSVISLVVCCLYCCSEDKEPSADEETPKESTPQTTQEETSLQVEDETTSETSGQKRGEIVSNEREEPAKYSASESEPDSSYKGSDTESDLSDSG